MTIEYKELMEEIKKQELSESNYNDCVIINDLKSLLNNYVSSIDDEKLKSRASLIIHNLDIKIHYLHSEKVFSKRLMDMATAVPNTTIAPKSKISQSNVDHPLHYNTNNPIIKHNHNGKIIEVPVECIDVIRDMPSWKGNAIKYLWRVGLKKDASLSDKEKEIEDLEKSIWYIKDRIAQVKKID